MSNWLPIVVVGCAAIIAVVTDVRSFRVFNYLTFPLILSGLLFHTLSSGWSGFLMSAGGAGAGFAILFIPFAMGAMGAGDVKLLVGFGAWMGTLSTAGIALVAVTLTAIYALVVLLARGGVREAMCNVYVTMARIQTMGRHLLNEDLPSIEEMSDQPDKRSRLIPFSVMLCFGFVVTLLFGSRFGL